MESNSIFETPTTLDGGFSAELANLGYTMNKQDCLWTARALLSSPDIVRAAHKSYLEAGAEIIETCTYQASLDLLEQEAKLTPQSAIEKIYLAVKLCKEARDEYAKTTKEDNITIAGSIGPYAVVLHDGSEYNGSYIDHVSQEVVVDYYKRQTMALLDGGVDILAFETIPSLKEAELIVIALKQLPQIPAWISFSCKDNKHTNYGDEFSGVSCSMNTMSNVTGIGINCTAPEYITSLLTCGQHAMSKPFLVYPNSGEGWTNGTGWDGVTSAHQISRLCPQWIRLGAKVIGGCCRIDSSIVRLIRNVIDQYSVNALERSVRDNL